MDHTFPEPQLIRARLLTCLGRVKDAEKVFKEVLAMDETNEAAQQGLENMKGGFMDKRLLLEAAESGNVLNVKK